MTAEVTQMDGEIKPASDCTTGRHGAFVEPIITSHHARFSAVAPVCHNWAPQSGQDSLIMGRWTGKCWTIDAKGGYLPFLQSIETPYPQLPGLFWVTVV